MVDASVFMEIMLGVFGSILLVVLIVLVIKLIKVTDKVNYLLDDINNKVAKVDKVFSIVDIITDNLAMISDKIADSISNLIRKILYKKNENRKEEIKDEEQ